VVALGVTSSPSSDALTAILTTLADNDKRSIAKSNLLETARSLNQEFGCLILDSNAQDRLREAVEQLESSSGGDSPIPSSSGLIGTWTLLCSTASASLQSPLDRTVGGIDTSKLPFFNQGPIKTVRDTFNKALTVQQVIKEDELTPGLINRIDHVLQYSPPNTLSAFLDNNNEDNDESAADTPSSRIPDAIKNWNINPLQVTNSKVVLVHKAEVQQVTPVLKTKLTLSSIIGTLSPW
jgi:PAP_fibrillin